MKKTAIALMTALCFLLAGPVYAEETTSKQASAQEDVDAKKKDPLLIQKAGPDQTEEATATPPETGADKKKGCQGKGSASAKGEKTGQ